MAIVEADIAVERNTYSQSRAGLDEISQAMQKQMDRERELREAMEMEQNSMIERNREVAFLWHSCSMLV